MKKTGKKTKEKESNGGGGKGVKAMDEKDSIGEYLLFDVIGRGAFGEVYKAVHKNEGYWVAIKKIPIDRKKKRSAQLDSLMMEIDLLKSLVHANIVRYVDHQLTDTALFIIMEFVETGSLESMIKKHGRFPESLVAAYMREVIEGLSFLHDQGVIHRDIKGANILITTGGRAKLADFGVSTKLSDLSNAEDAFAGTPYWMAPEIITMSGVTTACDIWSVGCTVIELLTGHPPYWTLPPAASLYKIVQDDHPPLPDGISGPLSDLLLQCFQKDVHRRITAKGMQKHPWLRRERLGSLEADAVLLDSLEKRRVSDSDSDGDDDDAPSVRSLREAEEPQPSKTAAAAVAAGDGSDDDEFSRPDVVTVLQRPLPDAAGGGGAGGDSDEEFDNGGEGEALGDDDADEKYNEGFAEGEWWGLSDGEVLLQQQQQHQQHPVKGEDTKVKATSRLTMSASNSPFGKLLERRVQSDISKFREEEDEGFGDDFFDEDSDEDGEGEGEGEDKEKEGKEKNGGLNLGASDFMDGFEISDSDEEKDEEEEDEGGHGGLKLKLNPEMVAASGDGTGHELVLKIPVRKEVSSDSEGDFFDDVFDDDAGEEDAGQLQALLEIERLKREVTDHFDGLSTLQDDEQLRQLCALSALLRSHPELHSQLLTNKHLMQLLSALRAFSTRAKARPALYEAPAAALLLSLVNDCTGAQLPPPAAAALDAKADAAQVSEAAWRVLSMSAEMSPDLSALSSFSSSSSSTSSAASAARPAAASPAVTSAPTSAMSMAGSALPAATMARLGAFCMIGGIPVVAGMSSQPWGASARLEASRFALLLCASPPLTQGMFVAAGGLSAAVALMEPPPTRVDAGASCAEWALAALTALFQRQALPRNDLCHLLSHLGLCPKLARAARGFQRRRDRRHVAYRGLLRRDRGAILEQQQQQQQQAQQLPCPTEQAEALGALRRDTLLLDLAVDLLFHLAQASLDRAVLRAMCAPETLKATRRLLLGERRRPSHAFLRLLGALRALCVPQEARGALAGAGLIAPLVGVLRRRREYGASEIRRVGRSAAAGGELRKAHNQALNCLFYLCQLAPNRAEMAVHAGVLPVLLWLIEEGEAHFLRELAVAMLKDLPGATPECRDRLWASRGFAVLLGLLEQPAWFADVTECWARWARVDAQRMEAAVLGEPRAIPSLAQVLAFHAQPSFARSLEAYLQLLTALPRIRRPLAEGQTIVNVVRALEAGQDPTTRNNLLKVLHSVVTALEDEEAKRVAAEMKLLPVLEKIVQDEKTPLMAKQVAQRISKKVQ